jgi:hypothetical protein
MSETYYIKIDSKNMHPETMDGVDLGTLVASFSNLFKHIDPAVADEVRSSLVSIEDNCIKLGFSLTPAARKAVGTFLIFAASENAPAIPYECNEHLRSINRITESYDAEVEMSSVVPNQPSVRFNKERPLPLVEKQTVVLKYDTSIYGKIMQVGGAHPNMHVAPLSGGAQVVCETSEDLAIQAAKLLYQMVRVTGEAREENGNLRMKAADITRFKGGSGNPFKGFEDLSLEDSLVAESVSEYLATLKEDDSSDG